MDTRAHYEGCDCGGEHHTTGKRSWCLDCSELCYPDNICEIQALREENASLKGRTKAWHETVEAYAEVYNSAALHDLAMEMWNLL